MCGSSWPAILRRLVVLVLIVLIFFCFVVFILL